MLILVACTHTDDVTDVGSRKHKSWWWKVAGC